MGRRGGVWDALSGFGSRVSVEWEGAGVRLRGVGINRPVHIQSTVHTERVSGDSFFLSVSSLPPRLPLVPTHESERVPLSPAAARLTSCLPLTTVTIERMIERLPRVFPSYSVALGSVLAVGRSGENPENPSSTYSIFLVNQNSSINSKNCVRSMRPTLESTVRMAFLFFQLTV